MNAPEEGVEQLDVRTMWPHEALSFTPWLAKNLHLLGAELGLKLELIQTEQQVVSLFLDILAEEPDTGARVVIENQLEWTDITHLGQLLTYATCLDARIAIWVAPEFRHECAAALHKLNQWTDDAIRFYGVKVELVRKPGGDPEPRFRTVVSPGEWHTDRSLDPAAVRSARSQQHYDFFQPLIEDLIRTRFADRATQYFGHTGRFFPSKLADGVGYAVSFWQDAAWVTLHIRMGDNDRTKRIFDRLLVGRAEIESGIGAVPDAEWDWDRNDRFTFSSISVRKRGSIDDPPAELEQTRAWTLDLLPKFQRVFDPRVAQILAESPLTNDR